MFVPEIEIAPLVFVPETERLRLERTVDTALGVANLCAQVMHGVCAAQGLVRLQ